MNIKILLLTKYEKTLSCFIDEPIHHEIV